MAWRIDESVIRGEIENRTRGRVTGRLWLVDRAEPVELDLAGDAWRDLAGRRLVFVNPAPKPGLVHPGFAARQTGVIGDCTASRKVKVPDVSMEEFLKRYEERKPSPWHWSNSVYLEWFSATNGRVVIESATFELSVSTECAWEMTATEEESQHRASAGALDNFMQRLGEAVIAERAGKGEAAPNQRSTWPDEAAPQTEEEAEKMQQESDRLADRIQARLDREGPAADYDRILSEELERRRIERGEQPMTPEEEAERAQWIDEANRAAEEALANPDPAWEAEMNRKHPLAEAARELSHRLFTESRDGEWLPVGAPAEHPIADLIASTRCAAAKLAGALNGRAWPPGVHSCASVIVRLRRARDYLDDALLVAEVCADQNLVDSSCLASIQRDLNSIGHECDRLVGELRALLARGFD